ncbi:hypothetical protein J0X19_08130 [Hymenobacter sp. BT186]|uniref:Uncharacterized protein n=1 Tax=Hymenobacter telluris TaxID=2816474 RepID=A0A939J8M5_9BACT|nr:hypothetical protein [Hymenobacter telluris]MBO0357909.1 hypothetical protein [Hymenobacter telluris]MBW3373936.1 hypothetical protein [Hymenobacter norwichensis]
MTVLKKYLFLRVFIANALIVAAIVYFLPTRFEENDDICMLLISSGSYSGMPDAHLVFINYIYGLGLKFLYLLSADIEWYTVSFLFLHILSISVLIFTGINRIKDRLIKLLCLLLLYSIELQAILHLQFTTTASLVGVAGMALLLEFQLYRKAIGILLCVISSLLRLEIFLVVLFISSPLFFNDLLKAKRLKASTTLASLAIVLVLVGLFEVVDQANYKQGDWKSYVEYNRLRGQINDNPNAISLTGKLPSAIKPVDYTLLLMFFQDGAVVNTSKLKIINSKAGRIDFTEKIEKATHNVFLYKKYLLLLAVLVALVLHVAPAEPSKSIMLITFAAFIAAIWALAFIVSLKYRLFISALLPLVYVVCQAVQQIKLKSMSTRLLPVVLLLLCLYSAEYSYQFIGQNNYLKSKITEQHAFVAAYLARSTNILVPYAADYRTEGTPVFSVSRRHFKKRMFFGGWLTNIPLNNGYYTSHHNFVEGRSLFLRQASKTVLPLLVESIYTNYGVHVKPVVVAESGDDVIVEFKVI